MNGPLAVPVFRLEASRGDPGFVVPRRRVFRVQPNRLVVIGNRLVVFRPSIEIATTANTGLSPYPFRFGGSVPSTADAERVPFAIPSQWHVPQRVAYDCSLLIHPVTCPLPNK